MENRKIRKDRVVVLAVVLVLCIACLSGGIFLVTRAVSALFSGQPSSAQNTGEPESSSGQVNPEHTCQKQNEEDVLITATGDMLLEDGFINWFGNGSWNDYMKDLQPWIGQDDLTIANLEVPIAGEELGLAGLNYCFNAPAETAENIRLNSIEFVSLANNHAMDRGAEGASLTIGNLDKQKIGHTGVFLNETDRNQTVIREINGMKIAILSWTYGTNQPVNEPWRVNVFTDAWSAEVNTLLSDLEKAREQADCVIVCMHWGTEFTYALNETQIQLSQMLADGGADVIIGNHPHTIQPAGWIEAEDGRRTLCFYSLGNLISSAYTVSRADETFQNMYEVGALAQFELKKDKDGVQVINPVLIPVVNHFEEEYENFRLIPLMDYTEDMVQRHSQASWSSEFTASWLKNQVKQVFRDSGIPVLLD